MAGPAMSADLVARLREEFLVDPSCSSGEAADRIEQLERDLGLEQVRAHLAAIPPEHPRWPDGTPVYIGQRVGWEVMRGADAWSSKVERLPDEYGQVVIRGVGGVRYEVPLRALVRLDPEGGEG